MFSMVFRAPFGRLFLEADDSGLREISFTEKEEIKLGCDTHFILNLAAKQLTEYFAGQRTQFTVPLAIHGTDFQRVVWEQLKLIPYGETQSYGAVAALVGNPKASRAVGMANHRNPIPIMIPCHRVIAKDAKLTGFAGGLAIKSFLLGHERFYCSGSSRLFIREQA